MASARLFLVYKLFLPDFFAVLRSLHWCSPFTDLAQVGAFIVIVIDPKIQIILYLINVFIDFLTEHHLIELLQNGFVGPLADAVDLR